MLGRAGRNGCQSHGHVFTDSRDMAKKEDEDLKSFCSDKENCRRSVLVKALGSREQIRLPDSGVCCDIAPLASVWNQTLPSLIV